ncbi:MAG: helix-turn-helix domain-containing protein [Bacilli bacterium]|nr:helix-turn-helix domain-containing protein [Bacilli bacterium]MDD4066036.1 helix-turn-helix domain-containing protein [Bacilli bacterium]
MEISKTYIATPPGVTIKEQLVERGLSQKKFAMRMDLSEKHISRLINGNVLLTTDVAMRLEMVLGIPASFWNNLEFLYRENILKVENENNMDEDVELIKNYPYSRVVKLGWLPKASTKEEKVINLRKFLGVVRLEILKDNQTVTMLFGEKKVSKGDLLVLTRIQNERIQSNEKGDIR